MNKPTLAVATAFSGRFIPPQWHVAMSSLQYPNNTSHVNICTFYRTMEDAFNELAGLSLQLGSKYTLFVDDDTVIPQSTPVDLMHLLENSPDEFAVAGGIYTTRSNPPIPLVFTEPGQGTFWKWKVGEKFPCWGLGGGSMMVKTEIFSKMSKPWFKSIETVEQAREFPDVFSVEELQGLQKIEVSVDLFFFRKLANMGLKCMAHGGVLPVHYGQDGKSYWLPAHTYPTEGLKMHGKDFGWFPQPQV